MARTFRLLWKALCQDRMRSQKFCAASARRPTPEDIPDIDQISGKTAFPRCGLSIRTVKSSTQFLHKPRMTIFHQLYQTLPSVRYNGRRKGKGNGNLGRFKSKGSGRIFGRMLPVAISCSRKPGVKLRNLPLAGGVYIGERVDVHQIGEDLVRDLNHQFAHLGI